MIDGPDLKKNSCSATPKRSWQWSLALAAVVLVAAGATVLRWRGPQAQPQTGTLDGQLTVLVRPPDRNLEPVSVFEPGALPVQHAGAMCLDARLKEPAFIYLVWIDAAGQVLPLYPWNNESLEIQDANEPPPVRRATRLVFSPLLGRNWTFGDTSGTETVLLLARRTPLPEETQIGTLVKSLAAPPKVEDPKSASNVSSHGPGKPGTPHSTGELSIKDAPLAKYVGPLGDHFELIHAVQFAHAENGKSGKTAEEQTVR